MGDEPAEPSEHHRDVRAEDPSGDVGLVDDHEREPEKEIRPPLVIDEHRGVEHVGVRHDEIRVSTDEGPLRPRRVAVVDRGADLRQPQRPDLTKLIASQRLRGEDVERGRLGSLDRRRAERDVRDERLPRRRPRRHDDVVALGKQLDRLGLMRIEPLDSEQRQALNQEGRDLRRIRREACRNGRQRPHVRHARRPALVRGRLEERRGIHAQIVRGVPAATR
jgi:hypothetical protein